MLAHYTDEHVRLYHGDCIEVMRQLPDASVDAVVTDPPYGLEFMGKEWDSFRGEAWRSGAGMSKPGIGERETAWPSFGRGDSANATCAECGGRMRGAKKCECDLPQWRVKGQPLGSRNNDAAQMRAFQSWCTEWAAEALRVLKPGGHLLAFGGTRTWHRLACAIEDAGFEVRDSIAWMYGSGFPKSLDVSKAMDKAAGAERAPSGAYTSTQCDYIQRGEACPGHGDESSLSSTVIHSLPTAPATPLARKWQGWGTALKPAFEPVVVARKPLVGTVAANVERYGTGALNIDGARIGTDAGWSYPNGAGGNGFHGGVGREADGSRTEPVSAQAGRWPANVILDESQVAALDRQSGVSTSQGGKHSGRVGTRGEVGSYGFDRQEIDRPTDAGGASRFFYTAKADSSERPRVDGVAHPTVKPLDLMRYLVRLVTPPGGVVLEPFAGSGTTLEACIVEGFRCIGIERESDYIPLIMARISKPIEPVMF